MADHDTVTADNDFDDPAEHDASADTAAAEEDSEVVEPAPMPNKTRKYARVSGWNELARPGKPHPTWWHPLNLTTWTGAIGLGVAHIEPSNLTMGISTAVAAWLGSGVGAACIGAAKNEAADDHLYPAGALGAVTGAGMSTWAWIASSTDLFNDMWQPAPWFGLAAGGVAFGAAYSWLRFRIAAARNPHSRVHHRTRLAKASGTWGEIMQRSGFGTCTVDHVEENWAGYTVWIMLDPERTDTCESVVNSKTKIVGVACRVLNDSTTTIGRDDITIMPTENGMMVAVRVRLRRVLTATIDPPADTGPVTDPAQPVELGRWEDGELIAPEESGPHGCAIGATKSGKSTYEYGLTAQWSRRRHVLNWPAGISKFEIFIQPWLQPFLDGECARPVFDMIGGGSSGSEVDFWSAAKVVACAYALMRLRQSSNTIPRADGAVIISAEYPRVMVQLDEVDALVTYKIAGKDGTLTRPRVTLPSGESKTVFDMMIDIASKGRSEGVELEFSTQRLTDKFWGGLPVRDLLTNVHRRAAFFTMSRHDASEMLKGTKLDSVNLRHNSMYMTVSADGPPMAGKACYYSKDTIAGYAVRADLDDTIGSLGMNEAAALGELYTARWNPERIGSLLTYFKADQSPSFRAFLDTRVTDKADPLPTASATSTAQDSPTRPDAQTGRQQLRDAIAKVKRENAERAAADAGVGRPDSNSDLLDQLWQLPAVDEDQRNAAPAPPPSPSIVDQVLALFDPDENDHVATADIAERLGRLTPDMSPIREQNVIAEVAREITAETGLKPEQRRNVNRYDSRTRGFLLEELRQHRPQ